MAFADELKDFSESFHKSYTRPSEGAIERARKGMGDQAGYAAMAAADARGASPNPNTDWARPAADAEANPEGYSGGMPSPRLPTFARSAENFNTEGVIERAKQALGGMESGNRYHITGPVTKGDRPYGRYQVMGNNIPSWTEAALGRRMSPQEFLRDSRAQDRVFEHRFGNYVKQHGLENALSMWHSGVPLNVARQQGRRDVNMPTTQYVNTILAGFNNTGTRPRARYAEGGTVQALHLQGGSRIPEWAAVADRVRAAVPQNAIPQNVIPAQVQTMLQNLPVQVPALQSQAAIPAWAHTGFMPSPLTNAQNAAVNNVNTNVVRSVNQVQGGDQTQSTGDPAAAWRAAQAARASAAGAQTAVRTQWPEWMGRWQQGAERPSRSPWSGMGERSSQNPWSDMGERWGSWGSNFKDTLRDEFAPVRGALNFARGGTVEDEEELGAVPLPPSRPLDLAGPAPAPAPARPTSVAGVVGNTLSDAPTEYASSGGDGPDPKQFVQPAAMPDIIDQAMGYFKHVFGLNNQAIQGVSPRSQDASRAIQMNIGAATPEQVEQIANTVDPKRKLSEPERRIAMYKGIYDYWSKRNEPEKASRAVFSLTMAAKEAAAMYGNVALQALQRGEKQIAADAIAKAYGESPDGQDMKITGVDGKGMRFELHDLKGNVTEKGRMAMDEMIRTATGMQNGSAWLEAMGAIRNSAGPSVDKVAARQAAEQEAYARFEKARGGDRDEREYFSTLNPQAQKEFSALPLQTRRSLIKQYVDRTKEDRAQLNTDYNHWYRELRDVEREEGKDTDRAIGIRKHLDNLKTRQDEMDSRAGRFRERMTKADERAARAGTGAPRLTAGERKAQALDTETNELVTRGREEISAMPTTGFDVAAEQEAFGVDEQTARMREMEGQVGAGRTYQRYAEATKTDPAKADFAEAEEKITAQLEGTEASKRITPVQRRMLVGVAAQIAQSNRFSPDQAAALALDALQSDKPLQYVSDKLTPGRVMLKIGNSPPAVVSSDTVNDILTLRGRRKTVLPNFPKPTISPTQRPNANVSGGGEREAVDQYKKRALQLEKTQDALRDAYRRSPLPY